MADGAYAPADAGLQVERTALAWRRTALSLVVLAAVGARLAAPVWGPAAWVAGGVVLALAGGTGLVTRSRLRRADAALRSGDARTPGAGGVAIACAAGATAVCGLVAVGIVLRW